MSEITEIRKILDRLTKYIMKPKGYICQFCGHKSLQPYGNVPNQNLDIITISLLNIKEK